ncbi:putative tRNA (guanine-N7-)-methyltransferase [Monocercomonoides exilis]|uniref:putative tRNA (guanine-N7-)-methyltransferase n=1 Tax=Monocercomonoides exilis TaxID=2049356 RepID=UPI003559B151|nr:putative tRNA (guanine-N7-)-methyltransferase [Monocercomonoides exilis]|eukprot:MONOS_7282.2-p1 / transcript=MONOS_7282.2 / gene=MONOS_7282 / organism=Monocercomonoides_exilis_PA203 / gene_product=tRNA / transcript_product=tRNA / location=Mono_scaffold00246:12599-16810(-) / protein_length=961 / sequence_SO=supercontig / SO=protein_coding / is_pseudo=false
MEREKNDKFFEFFKRDCPPRERITSLNSVPKTFTGLARLMHAQAWDLIPKFVDQLSLPSLSSTLVYAKAYALFQNHEYSQCMNNLSQYGEACYRNPDPSIPFSLRLLWGYIPSECGDPYLAIDRLTAIMSLCQVHYHEFQKDDSSEAQPLHSTSSGSNPFSTDSFYDTFAGDPLGSPILTATTMQSTPMRSASRPPPPTRPLSSSSSSSSVLSTPKPLGVTTVSAVDSGDLFIDPLSGLVIDSSKDQSISEQNTTTPPAALSSSKEEVLSSSTALSSPKLVIDSSTSQQLSTPSLVDEPLAASSLSTSSFSPVMLDVASPAPPLASASASEPSPDTLLRLAPLSDPQPPPYSQPATSPAAPSSPSASVSSAPFSSSSTSSTQMANSSHSLLDPFGPSVPPFAVSTIKSQNDVGTASCRLRAAAALSYAFVRVEMWNDAIRVMDEALEYAPEKSLYFVYSMLMRLFLEIGSIEAASIYLAEMEQIAPLQEKTNSLLLHKGLLQMAMHQYGQAASLFRKVVKSNPTNVIAVNNLALSYLYQAVTPSSKEKKERPEEVEHPVLLIQRAIDAIELLFRSNPYQTLHESIISVLFLLYDLLADNPLQKKNFIKECVKRYGSSDLKSDLISKWPLFSFMETSKIIFPKFRTRPHSNPLSDQVFDYPISPEYVDWGKLFDKPEQEMWCDLGCGYGGLLETLGPRFPKINIIGMELRGQVVDYVENRILKLRRGEIPFDKMNVNPVPKDCRGRIQGTELIEEQLEVDAEEEKNDNEGQQEKDEKDNKSADDNQDVSPLFLSCPELAIANPMKGVDVTDLSFARDSPPVVPIPEEALKDYKFLNIGVIRANSMKNMSNYFKKGGLTRMFILFPDPHWKHQHIRRRVVSPSLLDEYGYCLAKGGRVYTITDVPIVYHWMVWCFERHPLFKRIPEEELEKDVCYTLIFSSTADAGRAERKADGKFPAVFERI